jgi:Tat protein secretion system quality control protein TatD with DNase activity
MNKFSIEICVANRRQLALSSAECVTFEVIVEITTPDGHKVHVFTAPSLRRMHKLFTHSIYTSILICITFSQHFLLLRASVDNELIFEARFTASIPLVNNRANSAFRNMHEL